MKYVIMCGGDYKDFETPKQLTIINGETLVDRTIRLLKEQGINNIYISSNDNRFDRPNIPRLEHKNTYKVKNEVQEGYWLDAFYPYFKPQDKVCFLFGDVYYSKSAICTIVGLKCTKNTLFGTSDAKNEQHENWGEPFAYKVVDYDTFMKGIAAVKKMQDEGKTKRIPIVWELYRYLNNLDVNIQQVLDDTYVCIDDETMDTDTPEKIKNLQDTIGV